MNSSPDECSPNQQSERKKKPRGRRRIGRLPGTQTSYVWHYFDQLNNNTIKCRVCRYEFTVRRGTTELIKHLEYIHGMRERGVIVNDLSLIPTITRWPQKTNLRMSGIIYESFLPIRGGLGGWRCKTCPYTCKVRKIRPMFYHLKSVHWKANGPATDEFAVEKYARIAIKSSQTSTENKQNTRNCFTPLNFANSSIKLGEDKPWSLSDMDVASRESSNSNRVLFGEESMMNGNDLGQYKIKITLPDGKEVEGFVVGGVDNTENFENLESVASHPAGNNLHDESRIVDPITPEKKFSNLQRDVQYGKEDLWDDGRDFLNRIGDDRRNFNNLYSKMADENSAMRSNTVRKLATMRSCFSPKSDVGKIGFDLQVSGLNVPDSIVDVNHNGDVVDYRASLNYEYINTEKTGEKKNIGVITLNRPAVQNALCNRLVDELNDAVTKFDSDDNVGAIIITGTETVFAVDNDMHDIQNNGNAQAIDENPSTRWDSITKVSKPIIAAVNGYALGAGCELAMMCDIIYAGKNARFGQPNIVRGKVPGADGTLRLAKVIGKSKTMEMVLTGDQISAVKAEKSGLVSEVFPIEQLLSEAIKLGERISNHSHRVVSLAKEAVNFAYETTLQEGLFSKKAHFCGTPYSKK